MTELIARFNIFSNDIGSKIKCILSKLADDSNLSGAVDLLQGRDATLDRLEEWTHVNIMKLSKAKYKFLHLGLSVPQYQHRLG